MNDLLHKKEIINEDDNLLRRVMFLNPSFIKPDGTPASSSFSLKKGEPSHDKNFDTHAHDYHSPHCKTCSQCVGELHLTYLIKLHTDENGLSVDIERLTTHEASIMDRTKFRLFALSAKFTSSLGLANLHDPQPDNYAHALITGNITRSVSRKMADAARKVS